MERLLSISDILDREDTTLTEIGSNLLSSALSWGVLGFLLGRAAIFGEMWPFGLAFVTVWRACENNRWKTLLPLVTVLVGLTSVIGWSLSLPYYVVLFVLWLIPHTETRNYRLLLAVLCMLIKVPLHYLLQPIPIVFIVGVTECVLAVFCFGPLCFTIQKCLKKSPAFVQLHLVLFCFALIVSCSTHWGGFSPRLFLMGILIVLGARLGGLGLSCILGPSLATLALLLGESSQLVLLIVIVSLLVGIFHRFRWGYYVGPLLAVAFTFPGVANEETVQWLLVFLIAAFVARLIPASFLKSIARLMPGSDPSTKQQDRGYAVHLRHVLDEKIDQHLTVFEELDNTLQDVNNPLFHQQMRGMTDLLQTMKGSFAPQVQFTKDFEDLILDQFADIDFAQIAVLSTLDGFEVNGALYERCEKKMFCQTLADFCSGTLESQRYEVINCQCLNDGNCGFKIAPCPRYKLEIGRAQLAQGEISGDNQVTFEITNSKVAILISDGMGVGWKAHTESNVAVRLLESMIKAGYELSMAVWLVNQLLLLRNQEEMFVTIDLVVVDLFTGQLEFVKIGSAPSFIKRGRAVEIIYNYALPVGVLSQVDVQTDKRILKEGEILVMATDGVLDAQRGIANTDEWMCWNLRRLDNPQDMASTAEEILRGGLEQGNGQIRDDMMVVVARLISNSGEIEVYRGT